MPAEKIAFFINVYNALIVHGTVAYGVPKNIVSRIRFFGKVNYVIGGTAYTVRPLDPLFSSASLAAHYLLNLHVSLPQPPCRMLAVNMHTCVANRYPALLIVVMVE